MAVAADLREAELIALANGLVDEFRGGHIAVRAQRAQPGVVRVLDGEQGARSDEAGQHVVVERQNVDLGGVLVEHRREPHVLADDLAGRLRRAGPDGVRDAPRRVAPRPGFLRQGERDARLEGACYQCAFAVARAAGYA